MAHEVYRKIIELILKAAELAKTVGIDNILQPGLVKEMIIADILEHELITTKRDADARDSKDPSILYEYLLLYHFVYYKDPIKIPYIRL